MISSLFKFLFSTKNERVLRSYAPAVKAINALESQMMALSDDELKAKTQVLKERYTQSKNLQELLPEAFAVCREASHRVLGMRHFDVQLLGAMALHQGKIAEMRTGEGKTLVATLAAYLNALTGKGVHIVTVNDYLAKRDADWMGRIFRFLGLSVGVNVADMNNAQKRQAYACDILYGTNNEFGFDFLRDNMVYHQDERVQRELHYAIVDEVDSILIDEARTPLIISGQADDHTNLYSLMTSIALQMKPQEQKGEGDALEVLTPGHFVLDEKAHQLSLTDQGYEHAETYLVEAGLLQPGESLYDSANISLLHYVHAALRAQFLFHKNQHYVVQNDEIIIVDEFTGRLMKGRRWSDGLHQAVEAKERVSVQKKRYP